MKNNYFLQKTKKRYLKSFMPRLRKNKAKKNKLKRLFKEISFRRPKRGAGKDKSGGKLQCYGFLLCRC